MTFALILYAPYPAVMIKSCCPVDLIFWSSSSLFKLKRARFIASRMFYFSAAPILQSSM